jgi:hypothetical protein
MAETDYPNLQLLVDAYLNQDYDLHGETIADVLRVYRDDLNEEMRRAAVAEVEEWSFAHRQDMASAFESFFEREISVTSHGYKAQSFLDELKRVLSQ